MNKKLGIGVLAALILVGGYYVFQNSNYLMSTQKGVDRKNQLGTVTITGDGKGGCTVTIVVHNPDGTVYSSTTETGTFDKNGGCVTDIGTFNQIAMPIIPEGHENTGDPSTTDGASSEVNTAAGELVLSFSNQKEEKNFLDWMVYTTKTCFASFIDVEAYLKDQNYIGKYVADIHAQSENSAPWTSASDTCKSDGAPVEN